ncbi:hypothetical protein TMatcc_009296 [Talaromyces marneffei ATCC 18224]
MRSVISVNTVIVGISSVYASIARYEPRCLDGYQSHVIESRGTWSWAGSILFQLHHCSLYGADEGRPLAHDY